MATGAPGVSGAAAKKVAEELGKEVGYGTASIHHLSREGGHVRGMDIRQNSVLLVSTLYSLIEGREEKTGVKGADRMQERKNKRGGKKGRQEDGASRVQNISQNYVAFFNKVDYRTFLSAHC